jgi:hypothetical protein
MIKWIKKYKEIIYMVGIILSSIVGAFLGDGLIWKEKEFELRQKELDLNTLHEIISLREKKEITFNKIIELNNFYSEAQKKKSITSDEQTNFVNKFNLLFNNFAYLEVKLASLENRDIEQMVVPTPIKDNIPPRLISAELIDSVNLKILFR